MRNLVVSMYVSLDGVIEDPVGMEASGLGDWTGPFKRGPEGDQFKIDELFASDAVLLGRVLVWLFASDAVLLGRVTYDAFAPVWPDVKDEAGFGDRMNALPKYVPSRTLAAADWNNTTIWRGDLATEVAKLKAGEGGDIIVYGGAALVHTLAEHDLVDEFRLMIYPVVLGRGKKLFADGTDRLALPRARFWARASC